MELSPAPFFIQPPLGNENALMLCHCATKVYDGCSRSVDSSWNATGNTPKIPLTYAAHAHPFLGFLRGRDLYNLLPRPLIGLIL